MNYPRYLQAEKCALGQQESVVPGATLATYCWANGPASHNPRALALLLHGYQTYSCHNFLHCDKDDVITYGDSKQSSFVRQLNEKGIHVEAHDHLGHGRTSGLRGYFPSFSALVQDAARHVEKMRDRHPLLPLFVIGHSMGGTVTILLARDYPQLQITGICLSSAACEPPSDMFGYRGQFLASISAFLSAFFPETQVLSIPKDVRNPEKQRQFESDPLNIHGVALRARVGREFLLSYQDIAAHLAKFHTPVLAASGQLDTLVNPTASKRFIQGISSSDKTLYLAEQRVHNLFTENRKEEIWDIFLNWITKRIENSNIQ